MSGIIIGAGIGGLSTAIALKMRNIDVKIFEAANKLSPVGAGILVPPNAMIILDRYGLANKVYAAGIALDSLDVLDAKGKKISGSPACFSKNGAEYQTVAIHRGVLQSVFLDALPSDFVATGKKCTQVNTFPGGSEAVFEDGLSISGKFLVGADGLRSKVRESLFPGITLRYSGQTCWRGIANITLSSNRMKQLTEVWGAGIRFGFAPINHSQIYWYATRAEAAGGMDRKTSLKEKLLNLYREFPGPVSEIISQTDTSSIIRDDINDLSPLGSWFRQSAVLIGDAAHAATPNLGQGGAQAIEDSWVLAEKIAHCSSVQDAFEQFQATRFSKVRRIVNVSRKIGRVTNITNKKLCKIRNSVVRCTPDFLARKQSRLVYDVPY